jgi:hypothetical protein
LLGWESKPNTRAQEKGEEDDTDQVIMKYKEKDYTLEKFSERIQDLGFKKEKI